jgi:hypothetical protein
MAAPNLLALTSLKVDTAILMATTSETDLIPAITTNFIGNVDAVFAANIHPTVVGWCTLIHKKGGVDYTFANQTRIPVKTTVNLLLGKPLYLAEGDSLRVIANANGNIIVFAPRSIAG